MGSGVSVYSMTVGFIVFLWLGHHAKHWMTSPWNGVSFTYLPFFITNPTRIHSNRSRWKTAGGGWIWLADCRSHSSLTLFLCWNIDCLDGLEESPWHVLDEFGRTTSFPAVFPCAAGNGLAMDSSFSYVLQRTSMEDAEGIIHRNSLWKRWTTIMLLFMFLGVSK